jgi:hypothetical protein
LSKSQGKAASKNRLLIKKNFPMEYLKYISGRYKYGILLFGLAQHLYIGMVLTDMAFYTSRVWTVNMVILVFCTIGLFPQKDKWRNYVRLVLYVAIVALSLGYSYVGGSPYFMLAVSVVYTIFFIVVFVELFKFLLRPRYINLDIIIAAFCGYLLLIEINTFYLLFLYNLDSSSISALDGSTPASAFVDMVYFCTVLQTTIGFGDIAPTAPYSKLTVSFFGLVSQFYSIVLVGILLSKFTANQDQKDGGV